MQKRTLGRSNLEVSASGVRLPVAKSDHPTAARE
jgi:hypothetical protein